MGRIDVLVNNAGYGSYGALEDVPMDEARYQFEVNVFGAARLTQLVLPHMRENRSGKIVNITSMGGKIHTPLGTWYHATKFALEAISDCLRLELKPFGIDVIVIEPGGIRSDWGRHRRRQSPLRFQRRPVCAQGNAVANSLSTAAVSRRRYGSARPDVGGLGIVHHGLLKAFGKFHHRGCQIRVVVDDLPALGFPAVDIGDPMLDGNVAASQSNLTSLDADFISHIASRLEQLIVQADRSPLCIARPLVPRRHAPPPSPLPDRRLDASL